MRGRITRTQAQKPVALELLRDGHKRGQVIGDSSPVAETATAE